MTEKELNKLQFTEGSNRQVLITWTGTAMQFAVLSLSHSEELTNGVIERHGANESRRGTQPTSSKYTSEGVEVCATLK